MNSDPISEVQDDACPKGGQHDPIRIAYGFPSGDMFEAADRGEIVLGGCLISRSSPTTSCRKCGMTTTSERGPRLDGLAAVVLPEEASPPS
jgi:hypothetical protein